MVNIYPIQIFYNNILVTSIDNSFSKGSVKWVKKLQPYLTHIVTEIDKISNLLSSYNYKNVKYCDEIKIK